MFRNKMFAAILAFVASWISIPAWADPAEPGFALDARVTLDAFRTMVDDRLQDVSTAVRLVAATDEVRSGDWSRTRGLLNILAAGLPEHAAVWYATADGSLFTVEKGRTDESLRDREYFPSLLAGHDVVGSLVVSKSTGKRALIVASPVLSKGRVAGAAGVSIDAAKLSASIDEAIRFPQEVVFYILDGRGQTALHRAGDLIFAFPSDVGSPTLADAVKTMLSQTEGIVRYRYDGKDRTALFTRSPRTGWTYVIGTSHPEP